MPGQSKIANLLQSLLTFFVSLSILSCTDEFSITDYSLDKLESIAGRWESGTITRDPSIAVKVSGKSDATWVLKVTLEDGKLFFEFHQDRTSTWIRAGRSGTVCGQSDNWGNSCCLSCCDSGGSRRKERDCALSWGFLPGRTSRRWGATTSFS